MKISRWFDHQMLALTEADLLGRGSKRLCYAFPGKEALCVKVGRPDLLWKHAQKQSFAEESYLRYLSRRDGRLPKIFPEAFGWVPTNYGPGFVMSRITSQEGIASRSVRQLLESGKLTEDDARRFMEQLKQFAVDQGLLVSDWNIDNVIPSGNDEHLIPVMIDGFGPKELGIKGEIITRCQRLARYRTLRSWKQQYPKIEASLKDPQVGKIS